MLMPALRGADDERPALRSADDERPALRRASDYGTTGTGRIGVSNPGITNPECERVNARMIAFARYSTDFDTRYRAVTAGSRRVAGSWTSR
jgi:hypothetical protein